MAKISSKLFINILLCSIGFVNRCLSHDTCENGCALCSKTDGGLYSETICIGSSFFIRSLAIDLHLEDTNTTSTRYECVRNCEICKYRNIDSIQKDTGDYCSISTTFCKMLQHRPEQEVKL